MHLKKVNYLYVYQSMNDKIFCCQMTGFPTYSTPVSSLKKSRERLKEREREKDRERERRRERRRGKRDV